MLDELVYPNRSFDEVASLFEPSECIEYSNPSVERRIAERFNHNPGLADSIKETCNFLLSVVARTENPVENRRPEPEFLWNDTIYNALKDVEEFSRETHADY